MRASDRMESLRVIERSTALESRRILRMPDVMRYVGLKQSTVKKYVKLGMFPQPIHITPRAIGWRIEDLDRWLAARQPG